MIQKWFQIDQSTGNIISVESMSNEDASKNCLPGNSIIPADDSVNPATQRWDFPTKMWVDLPKPRRPEDDYRFMRRTGYPTVYEQVGVLMKIATYAFANEPVPQAVKDEFAAINADIEAIKEAHPKP